MFLNQLEYRKQTKSFQVFSLINGFSEHEAQPLFVHNIFGDKWVILDVSKRD